MAMQAREIEEWIKTLDPDDQVGVDEGGLTLVVEGSDACLEIGGMPLESEDEG